LNLLGCARPLHAQPFAQPTNQPSVPTRSVLPTVTAEAKWALTSFGDSCDFSCPLFISVTSEWFGRWAPINHFCGDSTCCCSAPPRPCSTLAASLSTSIFFPGEGDHDEDSVNFLLLPSLWLFSENFATVPHLIIAIGVMLFFFSIFGFVAAASKNR